MKKKIFWIALLFSLFGAWVYALTVTQVVDNTIVYLKKLIFTDDGTNLWNQKIVIDGTNGSITMNWVLNIQQGALKDNTVTTNDLVNGAVTSSKLANNSVNSSKIVDGSITSADIAPGAITQDKIASSVEMWVFKKNGTSAYYNAWNVWIWTSNPSQKLEVIGNIKATKIYAQYLCDENGANCRLLKVVNGQCGTSNGWSFSSQPTANLCAAWTVSWIDTTASDGTYNWTCQGQNGWTDASCSANRTFTYTWQTGTWWACSATCGWWTQTRSVVCKRDDGITVADSYCSSPKPATSQSCNTQACPVNWQCGSANGSTVSTQPTSNLCVIPWTEQWTDTTASDGTYNWICKGQNGWTDASCSATKQTCGSPITITVNGTTYTYNTKLMPDGKCWTSQNMAHPPKNLTNSWSNWTSYTSWWWYYPGANQNEWMLYTWWAAMGCTSDCSSENLANSVCWQLWPGWHLPSDQEWKNLEASLWCSDYNNSWWRCDWLGWASSTPNKKMWWLLNTLPWRRTRNNGNFNYRGTYGFRWSSSPNGDHARSRDFRLSYSQVYRGYRYKVYAFSIICLKN